MKEYIVYMYTFPNGKRYVGITENINRRFGNVTDYKKQLVYRAMVKYPEFTKEILYRVNTREEANEIEKLLIDMYSCRYRDHGYNLTEGGDGTSGYHHSEVTKEKLRNKIVSDETRRKISEANSNPSIETRRKMSESATGRKASLESKRKMSEQRSGANHHMYGKHHSVDTLEKLSHKIKAISLDGKIELTFNSISSVVDYEGYDFKPSSVSRTVNGKNKTTPYEYKGFIWSNITGKELD